jgi:lysophospholipase L1-like esterase
VIEEGLDGRTTDALDPGSPISGAQLDGSAYLPACLASHLPVDLVIIMLGTNDLKPVFNRTPLRIAIGAAHLIDLVNTLNGGVGTNYKNPKVLLICPARFARNPPAASAPKRASCRAFYNAQPGSSFVDHLMRRMPSTGWCVASSLFRG